MSDINLYRLNSSVAEKLPGRAAKLERTLQNLIEQNMETLLQVRFLATEYATSNGGRIDSLGIDENNCPVIIEYKRNANNNVINQGLFYYDWLLDHKEAFQILVMNQIDRKTSELLEWDGMRLICIASDFNKYDEHAIKQIDKNIELMRYKYFGEDLLLLELVNSHASKASSQIATTYVPKDKSEYESKTNQKRSDTHQDRKEKASKELLSVYEDICDYCLSLGDEVQRKELMLYTAFKSIRNFVCVMVWSPKQDPSLRFYIPLNPDNVELIDGVVSDVRNRGHWGTGDVEVIARNQQDLAIAKRLIKQSFETN